MAVFDLNTLPSELLLHILLQLQPDPLTLYGSETLGLCHCASLFKSDWALAGA